MKTKSLFLLFATSLALVTGCTTYQYQIVQPPQFSQTVAAQPVTLQSDPLVYHLQRYRDRLGITIENPTDSRVSLVGEHSYVVDPKGESHPVRGRTIGAHSFVLLNLPPEPTSYEVTGYGSGWIGGPYWGGFWNDFYATPYFTSITLETPFDWYWKTGTARLHLTFDRGGTVFEQQFEFQRQPQK